MNWQTLGLVMAGGALGAGGRHLIGGWLLRQAGSGFPWGTLAVNLLGSFLAGYLMVWLAEAGSAGTAARAFLIVGLMGGLTTYSALMLECLAFARGDKLAPLAGYLVLTLAGGLALVWAGARLAEALRPA